LNDFLNRKPLLILALSYIVGLIVALSFNISIPLIIVFAFLLAFSLLIWRKKRGPLIIFLSIFFLIFGFFRFHSTTLPLSKDHISHFINEDERVDLAGVLITPLQYDENRTRFLIEAKKIYHGQEVKNVSGKVRITVYEPSVSFGYKDNVLVKKVRLHAPVGLRNFKGFDYQKHMNRQGIFVVGGVSKAARVEVIKKSKGGFQHALFRLKDSLSGNIDQYLRSPGNSVIKAMVFGERGLLDRDIIEVFNNSGIAHLLAVSGLHLGFVAFASFFLIYRLLFTVQYFLLPKWLTYYDSKKISAFIALFPVMFYAVMVGYRIPTLRAGIMIATYLIAVIFNRHRDLFNVIALALLIILIGNPLSLFDIGFQLSFAAILGIALCISRFLHSDLETEKKVSILFSLRRKIFQYFIISLFASLSVLPVIAFYFNKVVFVGPLSNFIIVPIASFLIPMTLIFSFFGLLYTPVIELAAGAIGILSSMILALAKLFASLPFSFVYVQRPSFLIFLLYYIALSLILFYTIKRLRIVLVSSLFLLTLVHFSLKIADRDRHLTITLLDVGQGESAFIKTPKGQHILIDGGGTYSGSFEIGKRVILPFLLNHGVKKIDLMIGTHPHPDHMKGLTGIIKSLKVNEILLNKDNSDSLFVKEFNESALKRNIRIKRISSPYLYENGDIKLIFSHPSDEFSKTFYRKKDRNNRSLVFKLIYKEFSMLFTGDIEKDAEKYLLQNNHDLKADFLKIAHHGSRSSTTEEFLRSVAPETAVISVGRYNWFRFPSKEVVKRLEERNINIYRTGRSGAVRIMTDGKKYSVVTYNDLK
jgi:competence protein ComEC